MRKNKINIHFILILAAAVLWGTAGLFVRSIKAFAFSEMQLVFGRAVFTAIIVGLIILIKDKSYFKIKLKDLWLFLADALFSIVLFNFSYYNTMALASLSVAAVLLYTAPFFVVIISRIIFGLKLTANKCVACVVAFVGCSMVSGLFDSTHRISAKALFFGLLTGFGYALYTIFGELLLRRGYNSFTITFYVFLFASICCTPLINVPETLKGVTAEPKALVLLLLMAVVNTVIPYLLYTTGLKGIDPSIAPVIATVEPVVATLIGAVVFNEALTFFGIAGIILVLMSVIILNKKSVTVTANAKINLILSVNGKREDGYHLIDTVMQSVSLEDTVRVEPSKKLKIRCNIRELQNSDNIAYKAAELFFKKTGINAGANITVKKRIPMAAGLGGGSGNAAAVLVALNKLYSTELSVQELESMALCLGADVPFFITGGTVRAEGIGEKLTTLKSFEKGYFLLAKADKKPSTGEMYKRLDGENPPPLDVDGFINALNESNTEKAAELMNNSFCYVWQNNPMEKRLSEFNPVAVSLSGSGPTCFAFFTDKAKAEKALKQLKSERIECYLTKPLNKALIIE